MISDNDSSFLTGFSSQCFPVRSLANYRKIDEGMFVQCAAVNCSFKSEILWTARNYDGCDRVTAIEFLSLGFNSKIARQLFENSQTQIKDPGLTDTV